VNSGVILGERVWSWELPDMVGIDQISFDCSVGLGVKEDCSF